MEYILIIFAHSKNKNVIKNNILPQAPLQEGHTRPHSLVGECNFALQGCVMHRPVLNNFAARKLVVVLVLSAYSISSPEFNTQCPY